MSLAALIADGWEVSVTGRGEDGVMVCSRHPRGSLIAFGVGADCDAALAKSWDEAQRAQRRATKAHEDASPHPRGGAVTPRVRAYARALAEERRQWNDDYTAAAFAGASGRLRDAIWADGFGVEGREVARWWHWLHATERRSPAVAYGNARMRTASGGHIDLAGVRRGPRGEAVWP